MKTRQYKPDNFFAARYLIAQFFSWNIRIFFTEVSFQSGQWQLAVALNVFASKYVIPLIKETVSGHDSTEFSESVKLPNTDNFALEFWLKRAELSLNSV